jgi:hypothetical protein
LSIGAGGGVRGMRKLYKTVIFPLRWIFMPSKAKYAYLWAKTKKLAEIEYNYREMQADSHS